MAELKVYDLKKNEVGQIQVDDAVFGATVNSHLFYEVVKMQLANRRRGTSCTKGRGEVKGSTIKLFKQKGTGRSRKGSITAPGLFGGGVSHGPKPRSYAYQVPKKVARGALVSALSLRNQEQKLLVVKNFEMDETKTKALSGVLESLGISKPLIIDDNNQRLLLCASNLKGVDVLPVMGLNVYDILRHDELVLTEDAIRKVEARLTRPVR